MADEVAAPSAGPNPTATPGKITLASPYAEKRLDDALALSDYAVSAGLQTPAGDPLSFADIGLIQGTAARLGKFDPPPSQTQSPKPSLTASEWIVFEQAYYRLAVATSPVTAETLAATKGTMPGARSNLRDLIFGYSPALRFTRAFAFFTIALAAFVLVAECLVYVWGLEGDANIYVWQKNILESVLPWAYGALGSCAYLLRSAHYFIYQRSFDLRRKPEYFNRVLLGAISGGAIILFVNYLVDDGGGTVLHLSSAALGFVAGYSTDFLFNTIERVVAAIFPKTDSDLRVQPQRVQKSVVTSPTGGGDAPDGADNADGPDDDRNGNKQNAEQSPPKDAAKPSVQQHKAGRPEEQP
jgi:hypothetical protein